MCVLETVTTCSQTLPRESKARAGLPSCDGTHQHQLQASVWKPAITHISHFQDAHHTVGGKLLHQQIYCCRADGSVISTAGAASPAAEMHS